MKRNASVHPIDDDEPAKGDGSAKGKDVEEGAAGGDDGVADAATAVANAKAARANMMIAGPWELGPIEFGIYGLLQLAFMLMTVVALVWAIILCSLPDKNGFGIVAGFGLLFVLAYTAWHSKGLYLQRFLRGEIGVFRRLNERFGAQLDELTGSVQELEDGNTKYKQLNADHAAANERQRLVNAELQEGMDHLRQRVDVLGVTNVRFSQENTEHQRLNGDLTQQVDDFQVLEKRLAQLAKDCGGSTEEATSLMEKLERNVRLDTVNTVFQFFDRQDRNRDGKIDDDEIDMFVDSLSMLWRQLPSWDPEQMKESIREQGGLNLDQVHTLVEAMMLEEDVRKAEDLEEKMRERFPPTPTGSNAGFDATMRPGEPRDFVSDASDPGEAAAV